MQEQVYVTNRNPESFTDHYGGEAFTFIPGQPVLISAAAARHIFGLGAPEQEPALVRLGKAFRWDGASKKVIDCKAEGIAWLRNFIFEKAVMRREPAEDAVSLV